MKDLVQTDLVAGGTWGSFRGALDVPIIMLATSEVSESGGGLGDIALDFKAGLLDADIDVSPVGTEVCIGIDDDCDKAVEEDDAVDAPT